MAAVTIAESLSANTQVAITFSTEQVAQTFTAALTGWITSAVVNVSHAATDGTAHVDIYAEDGSNRPTGPVLATASVNTSTIGGVLEDITFTFNKDIQLVQGEKYVLVYRITSGQSGVGSNLPSAYSGGILLTSLNSGSSWTSQTLDMYFGVYGDTEAPVAGSGISQPAVMFESWGF